MQFGQKINVLSYVVFTCLTIQTCTTYVRTFVVIILARMEENLIYSNLITKRKADNGGLVSILLQFHSNNHRFRQRLSQIGANNLCPL
jgi:hypothetical protein